MKKKIECNYNRRNNLATVTIRALKSFDDECLGKIKQIAELFALKTLYFDFEVYEQDKEAIFNELRTLDEKAPCIVAKRKKKETLVVSGND